VMNLISGQLEDTNRHVIVWFNAWRYHREEDLSTAFYQAILQEFRRQTPWVTRLRVSAMRALRAGWVPNLKTVFMLGALVVCLPLMKTVVMGLFARYGTSSEGDPNVTILAAGGLGTLVTLAPAVVWLWQRIARPLSKVIDLDPVKMFKGLMGRINFVNDLKTEFELAFSVLDENAKLIVFVDDLDRCGPDSVMDMLEALNHLSETGRVMLVMGVDLAAVETAISVHFKSLTDEMMRQGREAEARSFGARYLDKMVTVAVNVPPLDASHVLFDDDDVPLAGSLAHKVKPEHPVWGFVRRRLLPYTPQTLRALAAGVAVLTMYMALDRLPDTNRVEAWMVEQLGPVPAKKGDKGKAPDPEQANAGIVNPTLADSSEADNQEGGTGTRSQQTQSPPGATGDEASPGYEIISGAALTEASTSVPVALKVLDPDPGQAERVWRQLLLMTGGLGGLGLLLLWGSIAYALQYRQQQRVRPAGEDSNAFKEGLRSASQEMTNPRSAKRFANFTRFMYYMLRPTVRTGGKKAAADASLPPADATVSVDPSATEVAAKGVASPSTDSRVPPSTSGQIRAVRPPPMPTSVEVRSAEFERYFFPLMSAYWRGKPLPENAPAWLACQIAGSAPLHSARQDEIRDLAPTEAQTPSITPPNFDIPGIDHPYTERAATGQQDPERQPVDPPTERAGGR